MSSGVSSTNARRRVFADTLEDVNQVSVGIDAV
jgi:hypothetical protein